MQMQTVELPHNKSWRLRGEMERCASTIHWHSAELRWQSRQLHAPAAMSLRGLICVFVCVSQGFLCA